MNIQWLDHKRIGTPYLCSAGRRETKTPFILASKQNYNWQFLFISLGKQVDIVQKSISNGVNNWPQQKLDILIENSNSNCENKSRTPYTFILVWSSFQDLFIYALTQMKSTRKMSNEKFMQLSFQAIELYECGLFGQFRTHQTDKSSTFESSSFRLLQKSYCRSQLRRIGEGDKEWKNYNNITQVEWPMDIECYMTSQKLRFVAAEWKP